VLHALPISSSWYDHSSYTWRRVKHAAKFGHIAVQEIRKLFRFVQVCTRPGLAQSV
jgi:hypothetical protein